MKNAVAILVSVLTGSMFGIAVGAETARYTGAVSLPNNPNLGLRTGSIPPQPGVELFVFDTTGGPGNAPYGTTYTLTFKTSEQPASVVAIPGSVLAYTYTEGTSGDPEFPNELVVEFTHETYAGGVEADLPGPPSDFSIAILPAGASGIPESLRGSYMATNISPFSWRLIPPSATSPSFGFELSGNNGQTAFLDLFVPDTLLADWSALLGRAVTTGDLALFSNNYQASTRFEHLTGAIPGALIGIQFSFNPTSNLVVDLDEDDPSETEAGSPRSLPSPKILPPGSKVTKRFTVGEAPPLSLLATSRVVAFRRNVTIYGWAKAGSPNEFVRISQQLLPLSAGPAKPVVKRVRLDADGKFVTRVRMLRTSIFKADHLSSGGIRSRSKPLRITVRGGGR